MQINIYWNDLSEEGKESLKENGFVPTAKQLDEIESVGMIDTEKNENTF